MTPNEVEDAKGPRAYRIIMAAAALAVLAIVVWAVIPPRRVDLRFLSTLHPHRLDSESGGSTTTVVVDGNKAAVELLLDQHLKGPQWKKLDADSYRYESGHSSLDIRLYEVRTAPTPIMKTHLSITDPRGVALVSLQSDEAAGED